MNVQLPPKRCDPVGKVLPKSQLLLKFLPDIFGKDLVLLQAVDDFLVERGQFPDLVLQNLFDVIAPERAEIVEADETVRIEGGHFFLDEIEQRRPDQIAEGSRAGRERFMTDLALRLGDSPPRSRMNSNPRLLSTSVLKRAGRNLSSAMRRLAVTFSP